MLTLSIPLMLFEWVRYLYYSLTNKLSQCVVYYYPLPFFDFKSTQPTTFLFMLILLLDNNVGQNQSLMKTKGRQLYHVHQNGNNNQKSLDNTHGFISIKRESCLSFEATRERTVNEIDRPRLNFVIQSVAMKMMATLHFPDTERCFFKNISNSDCVSLAVSVILTVFFSISIRDSDSVLTAISVSTLCQWILHKHMCSSTSRRISKRRYL